MNIYVIKSWDLKRKKYWYVRKKMDNSYVCTDDWAKALLFTNEQEGRMVLYKILNKYKNMELVMVDKQYLTERQKSAIYIKERLKNDTTNL